MVIILYFNAKSIQLNGSLHFSISWIVNPRCPGFLVYSQNTRITRSFWTRTLNKKRLSVRVFHSEVQTINKISKYTGLLHIVMAMSANTDKISILLSCK